jgi:hypothetical protein
VYPGEKINGLLECPVKVELFLELPFQKFSAGSASDNDNLIF